MILIKNARVYDAPDRLSDILIIDGRIATITDGIEAAGADAPAPAHAAFEAATRTAQSASADATVIDASGLMAAPGLVDMHVHFRQPGFEHKEDIATGSAAAAAGGVTTCCCMPNTRPVADNAATIAQILEASKQAPVRVLPYGAVTLGQQGRELADFQALFAAGAVALSDDGNPIQNADLMRRALLLAKEHGRIIVSHCEDADMVKNHALNEGAASRRLGLPGRPAIAEEIMVARDAMLAAETGGAVHIAHVSAAGSVRIIRAAKATGVRITAETCPQYFSLTEDEVETQGSIARVNPPLRTARDVEAVIEGLADGTLDVIATDHAPHAPEEKALPLTEAPSGMIGLETSLALALTYLHQPRIISLEGLIRLMSINPARILGLEARGLVRGAAADLVLFDPDEEWVVDPGGFKSKARNTPLSGMKLRGKVKWTISGGKIAYTTRLA